MNTLDGYTTLSQAMSALVTRRYSTSFSIGIRTLAKPLRAPIHAIYGFVRLADEIVDSFHGHDQRELLQRFRTDTERAIAEGISTNPILHSFQHVVRQYGIAPSLISAFLDSMAMDLERRSHDRMSFDRYVLGSAESVGLMCLHVFCADDPEHFDHLRPAAQRLGAAFQKINFLRDLQDDHQGLGRSYFPDADPTHMEAGVRHRIEAEIADDLQAAYAGIMALPRSSRLGVYVAYVYYRMLFRKIQALPWERLCERRVRVSDRRKLALLTSSYVKYSLGLIRACR